MPEVPLPAIGPIVHRTELDPSTGLYSLRCSECGAFNATAWGGLEGAYCNKHTPENIPHFTLPGKSSAYTERDIIELACRAPAIPDWFEPDMSAYGNPQDYLGEARTPERAGIVDNFFFEYEKAKPKEKLIQWPRAYAKMVLEAE